MLSQRHIDVLIENRLIGKVQSYYRIGESGLDLLMQVDQVAEEAREFVGDKENREK